MPRKSPAREPMPGPERDRIAAELESRYEADPSTREPARETDRSHTGVHRLSADGEQ
ncbi:helix-turn-helix domain-containing protein [Streptomyces sp. NPDC101194]|uniref:helix-turn-helix domain-containing protein n=1 Tax=Streptomyces sp. NPDC101194 TaxID=3366127 RepID=UPI0038280577